jgi:flagellar biosynthesis GTPase FlhF
MEIANPMYDVVFKYLMEDNAVAITFLSALTEMDIVSLQPLPQELSLDADGDRERGVKPFGRNLSIYRLDYSARIRNRDGEEKIIIVEIQQKKVQGQQMRFRKYLGKQYENDTFVKKVKTPTGREYDIGIPILAIYFIGEQLEGFRDAPIVLIRPSALERYSQHRLDGTNAFVEALFHEGIIINVSFLGRDGRDGLEVLLSIFSPLNKTTNPQIMSVQETKFMEKYQPILRRLRAATQDKEVRNKMTVEDDFLEEMERYERNYEEMLFKMKEVRQREEEAQRKEEEAQRKEEEAQRKEEEAQRKEEEAQRKEEEAQRKEEEAQRKEEEAQRKEEEAQRKEQEVRQQQETAVRLLINIGIPKAEIAVKLGLSPEDLERYG